VGGGSAKGNHSLGIVLELGMQVVDNAAGVEASAACMAFGNRIRTMALPRPCAWNQSWDPLSMAVVEVPMPTYEAVERRTGAELELEDDLSMVADAVIVAELWDALSSTGETLPSGSFGQEEW